MKRQDNSRDRLLLCLLIDHGLRVSEVSGLKCADYHNGIMRVYHKKVHMEDQHALSPDTAEALEVYLKEYLPDWNGYLFTGNGQEGRYTEHAFNRHVGYLGREISVKGLLHKIAGTSWPGTKLMREYISID